MISVVTTTISLGGLDVLFNSLAGQLDCPPYEVVLVDGWYEERKDLVAEWARGKSVKHLPLRKQQVFIDHCNGWNTGLAAAEGELVCFLNDFIWVYPSYLKDHWAIYKTYPGHSAVGYLDRYGWPPVKQKQGVNDIWWTAFEEELTQAVAYKFFAESSLIYQERKGDRHGAYVGMYNEMPLYRAADDQFYASLNESIPMAVLKELNGWDERYDGAYASNDIDLGGRAAVLGWKFLLLPTVNRKIGIRQLRRQVPSIVKPELRTPEENFDRYRRQMRKIIVGEESARVSKGYGAWE